MSQKKEIIRFKKPSESSSKIEASKLGKLLKKLDKDELKSLHKFLRSPWIGVGEPTVRLYEKIKAGFAQSSSISKHTLQKQLRLEPKALNKQMNALLVAVEKFLVHQALDQDEGLSKKLLMRAAKSHSAQDLFQQQVKALLCPTPLQRTGQANGLHEPFLLEFEVLSALYIHPNTEKFKPKVETLYDAMRSLDRYYAACKLFFACEVYNRRLIVGESMEMTGLDALIGLVEQSNFVELPIFQLYLAVLDRLRFGRDDARFEATIKLLEKTIEVQGKTELQALLIFLINHANHVYKTGIKAYLRNIFRLYLLGIRHGLIDTDGQLSPSTFVNVANSAVLCQKFSFAWSFIERAQDFLPNAEKKPAVHLAMAFLHFHQGAFSDAFQHAYQSDISSARYALMAKPLLLRSSFEELVSTSPPRNVLHLQVNIESFKRYIKREENLNKQTKAAYQRFASILQSMTMAVSAGRISEKRRERLLGLLSQEKPPFSKNWLEAKILGLP